MMSCLLYARSETKSFVADYSVYPENFIMLLMLQISIHNTFVHFYSRLVVGIYISQFTFIGHG